MTAPTSNAKHSKPLPLADTLRDLAFMRVSDIDLSALMPTRNGDESDELVEVSYEFVQKARLALSMHARDEVGVQGEQVESIRSSLEDLVGKLRR